MKKSNLCAVLAACIALFVFSEQPQKTVVFTESDKPDLAQIRADIAY